MSADFQKLDVYRAAVEVAARLDSDSGSDADSGDSL